MAALSHAAPDEERVVKIQSTGPNASAVDQFVYMCEQIRVSFGAETAKAARVESTAEEADNATVTVSGYCTGEPPLTR